MCPFQTSAPNLAWNAWFPCVWMQTSNASPQPATEEISRIHKTIFKTLIYLCFLHSDPRIFNLVEAKVFKNLQKSLF